MKREICFTCSIEFNVPDSFLEDRMEDGKSFKCPNGHSQYYPNEIRRRTGCQGMIKWLQNQRAKTLIKNVEAREKS